MTKTVKFNLILNDQAIRNLDDFRNNFSIEDVLKYYKNNLLHRWLIVRGFDNQYQSVNSISSSDDVEIIKKLIEIFEVETDPQKIEESVYILNYQKEQYNRISDYCIKDKKYKKDIERYFNEYDKLIENIIVDSENMANIKATLNNIALNFSELVQYDIARIFNLFYSSAPKAIFGMLTNDFYRPFMLYEDHSKTSVRNFNSTRDELNDKLRKIIDVNNNIERVLNSDLKVFSANTSAYWKDIEEKGKKYVIIKIVNGNYVRSSGKINGDLSASEINDKFLILDGIDYKSNNAAHKLFYLEV